MIKVRDGGEAIEEKESIRKCKQKAFVKARKVQEESVY